MKHLTLLFFASSFIVLGCNYIPCSASSDLDKVKQHPSPSSIAGNYKPDTFTKQDFKEYSNSDSTYLVIHNDGRVILKNFPVTTFGSWNKSDTGFVNGSGTWTFGEESGTTIINTELVFDQKEIMRPPAFKLFKKDGKYYILIPFGDPDVCTSVRLQQQ